MCQGVKTLYFTARWWWLSQWNYWSVLVGFLYTEVIRALLGIDVDIFSFVDREAHSITRTIMEAMFIRVNDPSLNKNLGKFPAVPHLGWVLQTPWLPSLVMPCCCHSTMCPSAFHIAGGTWFTLVSMFLPQWGCLTPWHQCVYPFFVHYHAIYSKYGLVSITFSFRPDEVMFDLAWQKLVYDIKLILLKQCKELYNNNILWSFIFALSSTSVVVLQLLYMIIL